MIRLKGSEKYNVELRNLFLETRNVALIFACQNTLD